VDLIVGDPAGDAVYKYSGLSSIVLDSFVTTGHSGPNGVTWDGTNVLVCPNNNVIYKHSGFSATVTDTISAAGSSFAYGIT